MIENEYGKLYLSEERAKEYIDVVGKHHRALLLDLKQRGIVPSFISIEKTIVREYEDAIRLDEERQAKRQNI